MLYFLSWRDVMVLNVIPGVLMSCIILINLGGMQEQSYQRPPAEDGAAKAGPPSMRQRLADLQTLLANRTLAMLSIGSAFRSMTQSSLLVFLPLYLATEMQLSTGWIGACLSGMQIAGFVAAPVAGHLSDSMGRRRIIVSSMATSCVILLLMGVAGRSPLFVFLIAFLGFFLFAVRSVLQAWLLDATPPSMGGTSIGILFGMQAVGSAIGPAVAGKLADHFGLMAVFYFLACTIVVANMFVFFTPAPAEPHRFDPSAAD
jgi:predicted MFS family arabinose efflux permease